ncbi:MAG: GNAT family N-acetyltransferase [Pseudomonadota bacterium]
MNTFDDQPVLEGDTLLLRPLVSGDLQPLFDAASDPVIWAGHPARDRYKRAVFEPYFHTLLDLGGTLVVVDRVQDRVIGCSRYYTAPDMPGTISIGFTFLRAEYWGGTTNLELKRLMLKHAFEVFDAVWFHIDPTNIRSQKATRKLGAINAYDAGLDLSGVAAPWKCYRLTRDEWQSRETS